MDIPVCHTKTMKTGNKENKSSTDEDIKKLVIARLQILSSNTMISVGPEGSFSRDDLIEKVKEGDRIGKKIVEVQMEWLRSFKP